jgi:ComF family protein
MKISRYFFFLREFFFPSGCALCGATLINVDEAWYGLCGRCRETLTPAPGETCDCCGRPLVSEQGRCLACRNGDRRNVDRGVLIFPYTGKYRKLLSAYKFGKNLALGHFFAEKILDSLKVLETSPPETTVVVPVPPRPGKMRRTGWDQIEYLAKLLEKGRGAPPVNRCLKRLPSQNQKELNRENRKTNLRGRIILKGTAPRRAVILDDVCTTGSTLETCAAALKAGGAETVYGLCLFYD